MRRDLAFGLQLAFTLLVSAFLILPIGLSILTGFTANFIRGPLDGLTLRWVLEVWSRYGDTILLSLGLAVACLVVDLLVGVPAAYVLAKRRNWLTRIFEEMIVLPVAVPGLATALALVLLYGRFGEFRTSWLFLLIGHVLYTLPFMVRAVLAVLSSIDLKLLEEGAASLGAGCWTRLRTVVLPNITSGVLAGALTVLTLSIGEFNVTLLLSTPTTQTMPVGLAVAYTNARIELGSAYTILFFVMIVPLLIAMQAWGDPTRVAARRKPTLKDTEEA
ncbi:ABC transporter permease [Chelatococcus sp. GCM10030263]|uniref:ABC transporter permease n=1 Tax=Chelatococcus sp. GCM10030263 TaxID=3273387 RepID=UPI00361DF508